MAKSTTSYACTSCGASSVRWTGRCSRCGEFGTVAEVAATSQAGLRASTTGRTPTTTARRVRDVAARGPVERMTTGIGEFDRVLGGGLVAGQVLLLSGEPGAGKSTLLLEVADAVAKRTGRTVLYLSGEESVDQLAVRARRIGVDSDGLLLADDTELATVIGHVEEHAADLALVIVDSVQTVASAEVEGRAGGVSQVMAVAQALTRVAKTRNIPVCLVGQVTKESTVAGPRALEHVVDATLTLEGDRQTFLRILRTVKNRYGPADEVACFEQTDDGLVEVPDPSQLFRGTRDAAVPGSCVTVTIEGRRPLVTEIQALVTATSNPNPRRGVSGLDSGRMPMLVAICERTARLRLHDKDVYLATVGGIRLSDPAADLATCLAVLSAGTDSPVPVDAVALGEVTLSGDVRPVPMLAQRVAEAVRLGYQRILVPQGTKEQVAERDLGRARLYPVPTLVHAQAVITRLTPLPGPTPLWKPSETRPG